jgi:hypothetical protein
MTKKQMEPDVDSRMGRTARECRANRSMFSIWATTGWVAWILVILVILSASLPASAQTSVSAADPAGDASYNAPGFMDIIGAEATKSGQTYGFQMSLAAPIPAAPPSTPPGTNQIQWDWPLETDPTTFPVGAPFPPGSGRARPAEFIIHVSWDGSSFSSHLTDRRPLLSGGEAVLTPLPFTISGSEVRVDVEATLLDQPSSFGWGAVTFYWSSPPGGTAGVTSWTPSHRSTTHPRHSGEVFESAVGALRLQTRAVPAPSRAQAVRPVYCSTSL